MKRAIREIAVGTAIGLALFSPIAVRDAVVAASEPAPVIVPAPPPPPNCGALDAYAREVGDDNCDGTVEPNESGYQLGEDVQ